MEELNRYEVRAEDGIAPPYILLLLCHGNSESFEIVDPVEKKTVYHARDYQTAKDWLLEDEYVLLQGRMLHE